MIGRLYSVIDTLWLVVNKRTAFVLTRLFECLLLSSPGFKEADNSVRVDATVACAIIANRSQRAILGVKVSVPSEGDLQRFAAPELTVRAVLTGMLIGACLTPCNVYSGLKIGWTFNMSVAAGLIAFAFWTAAERSHGSRHWSLKENNINQTAASAAASIISSGLAAPIPALALLTGQTLAFPVLATWLFVVSLLGVVVAAGLYNQLLVRERLPFPSGIVTAETMREIHERGPEAHARLKLLGLVAAGSGLLKTLVGLFKLGPLPLPWRTTITSSSGQPLNISAMNLGFALDPSLLMAGFGAIAGLRIAVSMLAGALLGWGVLAPMALSHGWAKPGDGGDSGLWFGPLVEWLLWPGATLMVTASLTAFLISIGRLIRRRLREARSRVKLDDATLEKQVLSPPAMAVALGVVGVLSVLAQTQIFAIGIFEAIAAVLLSYVLAIVAARVSGETAITPIGALGKITQLTFGALSPGNTATNLMTANVTGGAAGQCADLMHDLRTGQLIGATPSLQIVAQFFGVLAGSLAAAMAYLLLIPSPQTQLITPEWPAPAVATWKAVAEVLAGGLDAMPEAAPEAIAIAALVGVGLAVIEGVVREVHQTWVPSASAIGLGFVVPAWNAISMFLGAAIAAGFMKAYPELAKKRIVVVAAGLIVGESFAGIGAALFSILK